MSTLMSYITQVCGYVWNTLLEEDMLPGLKFKTVFIFVWLALILVEFFRVFIFASIEDALDDD